MSGWFDSSCGRLLSTAAGSLGAAVPRHLLLPVVELGRECVFYVAECWEVGVVTQGRTLDEVVANLREALTLHPEGEDRSRMPP